MSLIAICKSVATLLLSRRCSTQTYHHKKREKPNGFSFLFRSLKKAPACCEAPDNLKPWTVYSRHRENIVSQWIVQLDVLDVVVSEENALGHLQPLREV